MRCTVTVSARVAKTAERHSNPDECACMRVGGELRWAVGAQCSAGCCVVGAFNLTQRLTVFSCRHSQPLPCAWYCRVLVSQVGRRSF
jgi:hypothetical protein